MTLAEDIVAILRMRPGGASDAELARATGKLHQQVNQRCRALAAEGVLRRDDSTGVILNRLVESREKEPEPAPDHPADWFWEGNVQASLCRWLVHEDWSLVQVANTGRRQQGTDVEARRGTVRLHVEVKGFPSTSYRDPRRAGETKPTQPAVQATHWYAEALLKVLRLREAHPQDAVAVAFPDFPRYRTLHAETRTSLRTMRIDTYWIDQRGAVEVAQ